jgi:hypothetical protein
MSTVKIQNFTCWTTRRVLDYSSKATMTQIVRDQVKELEIQNMQKLLNIQASKKLLKSWHVWSKSARKAPPCLLLKHETSHTGWMTRIVSQTGREVGYLTIHEMGQESLNE